MVNESLEELLEKIVKSAEKWVQFVLKNEELA